MEHDKDILNKLIELISQYYNIDNKIVLKNMNTVLTDKPFNFISYDLVDLFMLIKKEFNFIFPEQQILQKEFSTLNGIYNVLIQNDCF